MTVQNLKDQEVLMGYSKRETVVNTKWFFLWLVPMMLVLAVTGCRSPYFVDRGAAVGAVTGALAGAAIGENNGDALPGAVIGSAVGALTGAVIGDSIDAEVERNNAMVAQAVGRLPGAVTSNDVIAMTHAGLAEQVIITHIQNNGVANVPQVGELISLQKNGVSPNVIQVMQQPPVTAIVPVSGPRPVMIEEYYYDRGPPFPRYGPIHCRPAPRRAHPWMHWGVSFHN
jgi:outer membrane lipoprotein SlyB